jgi:hypothetical protein
LKQLPFVLLLVAVVGIAACGSKKAAAPLRLNQRVPSEADAPGSQPDPVETPRSATGVREFIEQFGGQFINPNAEDLSEFKQTGFLSAIRSTRFFPDEPGAAHEKDDRHVFASVLQFKTDDGAKKAIEIIHRDSLRPCPKKCSTQIREFDVDGIPDASGVRRFATAEDIKATGDKERPYESYAIEFTDGPFAYDIKLSGLPGQVSEDEADEIAKRLYDRVAGAPPQA